MPVMADVISLSLFVISIILHELAHGIMAYWSGDSTAKNMKRLTLNPISHMDPIGSVFLPLSLYFMNAPFLFGYAKPVPINPRAFYHFRPNMIMVAAAGPLMNILLGFVGSTLLSTVSPYWEAILLKFVILNFALAVFNLFPVLPLDGGRIFGAIMPYPLDRMWASLEKYGLLFILALFILPSISEGLGNRVDPFQTYIRWGVEHLIRIFE